LIVASRVGDKLLVAGVLQHQASLADDLGDYSKATVLYQRALKLFQEMDDKEAVMRTCNLLGVVERRQGRLSEARTWYERSREIANSLSNLPSQAAAAINLSVISQIEGEAARQQGFELEARQKFEETKRYIKESLTFEQLVGNEPNAAKSLAQLSRIQLYLGEVDEAERNAHEARKIQERLHLKEVYLSYNELAIISRARGDNAQAAEWERKRDAVFDELERRVDNTSH